MQLDATLPTAPDSSRLLHFILLAGGTAALLDGLLACTFWGVYSGATPVRIFQSVSAGLLGRDAFNGGVPTALLGLVLHIFIAGSMATAYGLVAREWPMLLGWPVWLSGLVYGLILYGAMHLVVLPLSRASAPPTMLSWRIADVGSHLFFVGLTIALWARWLFGHPPR
jgi:hypothetical protein